MRKPFNGRPTTEIVIARIGLVKHPRGLRVVDKAMTSNDTHVRLAGVVESS
jgi:methylmalonyl-CoA mutase cobalamin-binding subunit